MNIYQKGFAPIIIALIVLFLTTVGGTSYYLIFPKLNKIEENSYKLFNNSLVKEKIKIFIQEDKNLTQNETSKIYPNGFSIEEMLQKINQYVGGMKLTNIEQGVNAENKPGYVFMFTGPIKIKGNFYNYPKNDNWRDVLSGYTCLDSFSDDSAIKIPYILVDEENKWDFPQGNICIKTEDLNNQLGEAGDGGEIEIMLNKYVIAIYPTYFEGVDKNDLISPVSLGEIISKKIIKLNNSDLWNVFDYNFENKNINLKFRLNPAIEIIKCNKYQSEINDKKISNVFCGKDRSSDGMWLMQYLGGFGMLSSSLSIKIVKDEDIELKEWIKKNSKIICEDCDIQIEQTKEYKIDNYPAIEFWLPMDSVNTIIKIDNEYVIIGGVKKENILNNLTIKSF